MKRKPKVQTVTLRGKRYGVVFKRQPRAWGSCDYVTTPAKKIVIDPDLSGYRGMDNVIHELTHGGLPELREDVVAEFAADLTRAMRRMGFIHVSDIESDP